MDGYPFFRINDVKNSDNELATQIQTSIMRQHLTFASQKVCAIILFRSFVVTKIKRSFFLSSSPCLLLFVNTHCLQLKNSSALWSEYGIWIFCTRAYIYTGISEFLDASMVVSRISFPEFVFCDWFQKWIPSQCFQNSQTEVAGTCQVDRWNVTTAWATSWTFLNKCLRGSPPPAISTAYSTTFFTWFHFSGYPWVTAVTLPQSTRWSHVKKAPPSTLNFKFFTSGHWGPLCSQRKTSLLFSGYFSKFWKAFSCDRKTDGQTDFKGL